MQTHARPPLRAPGPPAARIALTLSISIPILFYMGISKNPPQRLPRFKRKSPYNRGFSLFFLFFSTLLTAVYAGGQVSVQQDVLERGLASYYAGKFQGRLTANGEIFDTNRFTAAHKTLPFQTIVRVTNESSGESVLVRINDRGPFVAGRIIDLSRVAAEAIGMVGKGLAQVKLQVVELGDGRTYHKAGPPSETVAIQVGAFGDKNNATKAVRVLESSRLAPVLETSGGGLARVILPEIHAHELELMRLILADLGFKDVFVRR